MFALLLLLLLLLSLLLVILVFWRAGWCDHLAFTTRILWPNSGRINVPVLSDSSEKKDDPYSNWDVTANPIVFLAIGCLFLDMMCFFLEEGGAQSFVSTMEAKERDYADPKAI